MVAQGVALETVRSAVMSALSPAGDDVPDLVPYGAAARKALELTFREALRMGHNYVGTEHILLALIEMEDGTGPLADLGIDKPRAGIAVTAALSAHQQ